MRSALCVVVLAAAVARAGPNPFELKDKPVDIADIDLDEWLDLPIGSVSFREQPASEAPAAVFVLAGDDLRALGFRTLDEALRTVPGLFVAPDGVYANLGVRGLSLPGDQDTRVLFLVDGHPINNALGIGQSYMLRDLPVSLQAVERVEIIQGPIGGVYGPTAFMGVVNVVTRRSTEHRLSLLGAAEAQPSPSGGELAGTWSATLPGAVSLTVNLAGFHSAGGAYTFPELSLLDDRPAPPNLRVATDWQTSGNAYVRASWRDFTLQGGYSRRHKGLPNAPYGTLIGDGRSFYANELGFAALAFERAVTGWLSVLARASFNSARYDDFLAYADVPFLDAAVDRWVTGEARVTVTPIPAVRLVAGAQVQQHWTSQRYGYEGNQRTTPVNFLTVTGYALADARLWERLLVQAGFTWHRHALFGEQLTPRFSAVLKLDDATTAKVLVSGGFRTATLFEAFYDDGESFKPDPTLRADRALSIEASVEHRFGSRGTVSLTGFHTEYLALIRQQTTIDPDADGQPGIGSLDFFNNYVNSQYTSVHGAQLGVNLKFGDRVRTWGGVSVQAPLDARTELPGFAYVTGNLAAWCNWPWRPLTLGFSVSVIGPRAKDPSVLFDPLAQGATVGTTVWSHVTARLQVPRVPGLVVQLSVFNLAGAATKHPLAGDYAPISAMPEPGPVVRLGVEWSL